jgi:alkanesulfonate monooxygenase SsuD/methylene tetrahydromethanopterin reductase-like flavin-dependent oxidoreductase (luciferase family)
MYPGACQSIKHARLYGVPMQKVPIYMAAGGPKSMRLAGEQGDGLITDGERVLNPELRKAFAEGAHAAGKDSNQIPAPLGTARGDRCAVLAEHMVVVGGKDEAAKNAEL